MRHLRSISQVPMMAAEDDTATGPSLTQILSAIKIGFLTYMEERIMQHVRVVTQGPLKAADMCADIQSDYQAALCFLIQVLTTVFLPLVELKTPSTTA